MTGEIWVTFSSQLLATKLYFPFYLQWCPLFVTVSYYCHSALFQGNLAAKNCNKSPCHCSLLGECVNLCELCECVHFHLPQPSARVERTTQSLEDYYWINSRAIKWRDQNNGQVHFTPPNKGFRTCSSRRPWARQEHIHTDHPHVWCNLMAIVMAVVMARKITIAITDMSKPGLTSSPCLFLFIPLSLFLSLFLFLFLFSFSFSFFNSYSLFPLSLAKGYSSTDSPVKVQVSDFDDMKWFNPDLPFNSSSPKSNSSLSIHWSSFPSFHLTAQADALFNVASQVSCCETIKSGCTCLTLLMSVLDG